MPSYKVLEPGFFNGRLYHPEGKRAVLHTDKPFPFKVNKETGKNTKVENVPSWLKRLAEETAAQKKKREAAEAAAAEANEKAAADQKDIKDANFLGDGEKSKTVETL